MSDQIRQNVKMFGVIYQKYLDDSTPYWKLRWAGLAGFVLLYMIRVYFLNGFFIITYGLGIYYLNLLIGYLSPKDNPEFDDIDAGNQQQQGLPMTSDDAQEYKPFIPKYSEFYCWHSAIKAILICIVATFIPALDIPVFWPILLVYFLALSFVTLKKQIQHMIKYGYVPFMNFGKPRYK